MNKKEPLKSDMIRQLLEKYYSGESTVEENAAILEYFRNTAREDLDTDLREDYDIFTLEADALEETEMPPGLEADLLRMIDSLPEEEDTVGMNARVRRAGMFRKILVSVSVAASMLIVFAAGWMFLSDSHSLENKATVVAETSGSSAVPDSSVMEENSVGSPESPESEKISGGQTAAPARRVPGNLMAIAVSVNNKESRGHDETVKAEYDGLDEGEESVEISESPDDEGYIVITDPDEAVAIAKMAFAELGNRLGRMNETVQEADSIISFRSIDTGIISEKLNKFVENEKY